jgi:N-acetylglucosamine-6-sulfatase
LLIRYPKLVSTGEKINGFVVSIDLAPTVLDIAGVEIPKHVQGKSMAPLLSGEADAIHDAILIEYYSHENPFLWTANLDYRIVRKGKYKYIRWIRFEDEAELYDMEADPYELVNLAMDPDKAAVVDEMEEDMRQLVLESLGLTR